ncbi:MAG: extracellular solute-binding protein [Christensenellales bacterium]|jgi:putative aldouronate transport system substrate-binding protein
MKILLSLFLCTVIALMGITSVMAESTLPIVEEPVTYTIMANLQGNDVNPKEVPLQKRLEENTNVHFEWTVLTNAETAERISTVMASGDLPDVFINCLNDSHRLTYGQAGALLPINEYLDYMPNFVAMMKAEKNLEATLTLPDGNIYSIPQVNMYSMWPGNGAYISTTVSINQKWLDAVGMEAPKTTAEMTEVLRAFRDKDPNGNKEADEIGLSFMYDQGANSGWSFLFGPFGLMGFGGKLNVENGKVFYAIQDERYVQAVNWIKELFKEGLIDPEVFTMDQNRYYAKIAEGNIGVYIDWQGTTYKNDPADPTYVLQGPLTGPDGVCVYSNSAAGVNRNYCMISSTAKNPEILCKYFDYMLTEEITFQTLWGAFGDYSQNNGDGTYTRYVGSEYPQIFASAIRVMPGYFSDELVTRTTILNKDTGELKDKTGEVKYIASKVYSDYAVKEFYPNIMLDDAANERIAILETPVTNAIKEKEIAWMMGESDINEEYEAFIAELNTLGLEEMTQIYQDAYTKAMSK